MIHMDVAGPATTVSYDGYQYVPVLMDDYTRYTTVILMRRKSQVYDHFLGYINLVKNQFKTVANFLMSDNGSEFVNKKLRGLLHTEGIIHRLSAPREPAQNGKIERRIGILKTKARSLLTHFHLPLSLCSEAITTAYQS